MVPFARPSTRLLRPTRPALAAALLAVGLLTGAPALHAKEQPSIAVEAGFNAAEMSGKVFTSPDPAAFKGLSRVAVPLFTVEFITADNVSAETSGFAAAGRARASAYYKLIGVDEPEFQALTDALYADFLRDLKASGLDVVTTEQLLASPTYRKITAGGSASPIKSDSTQMLAPAGLSIYGFSKASAGGEKKSLFGTLSSIGAGFAAVSGLTDTIDLQKELGAAIVEVQMRVHFVQLTNNNKGFLGRLSSTASVSGNALPSVRSATLNVQTAATRSVLTLQNPLTFDGSAFSEVREEATTAGDVAGGVAVALLQMATGSKDSSSTEKYEAVADPVKYREVVGAGLGTVREMMLAQLKAGR